VITPAWAIHGGSNANEGEFPSVVAIEAFDASTQTWYLLCTGAYLGGYSVLTAAHCVDGQQPTGLRVMANSISLSTGGTTSNVVSYAIHEAYNTGTVTLSNDIAILNVADNLSSFTPPVQLPLSNWPVPGTDDPDPTAGQVCSVVGWGRTASNVMPDILQQATMTAISTATANQILSDVGGAIVGDNQLALYDFSQAVTMDSGDGPVFCNSGGTTFLAGIRSWNVSSSGPALASYPSVTTRVSAYLDWISNAAPPSDPFPIPFPQMPDNGGSTLPKLQLVTISFQGDTQWDGSFTSTDADQFGDFIVQSQWLQTVTADYRTSSPFVATHLANYVMPPYAGGPVEIPALLQQLIDNQQVPLPADTSGLLYAFYVPGGEACQTVEYPGYSYHNFTTVNGVEVAYVRSCGNALFSLGSVGASHEVAEAITDPFLNAYSFSGTGPWAHQGEVGDACEGSTTTEGGWPLATIWSNSAAKKAESPCIPAPAMYHNVSPSGPLTWDQWDTTPIVLQPNVSVTVTLRGWSYPADASPWNLETVQSGSFPVTVSFSGPVSDVKSVDMTLTANGTSGQSAWVDVRSSQPGGYGVWPFRVQMQ
jgi:trypsin